MSFKEEFGDISVVPTSLVFYRPEVGSEIALEIEKGKMLYLNLLAMGRPLPNGERECFWEMNGNARGVRVVDTSATVATIARERADPSDSGSVGAPMGGVVVEIRVEKGSEVKAGDPLVVLSAMKMETVVNAPVAGTVQRIPVSAGDSLGAGDLVATIGS